MRVSLSGIIYHFVISVLNRVHVYSICYCHFRLYLFFTQWTDRFIPHFQCPVNHDGSITASEQTEFQVCAVLRETIGMTTMLFSFKGGDTIKFYAYMYV